MVRAVTPIPFVKARFFDRCGKPLTGGQIYTYEANTTTPKVTYKDPYGLTPNTNPIILDAAGEADIYLDGTYRIRITDRNDVLVNDVAKIGSWFSDNLQDTLDNISGAMDDAIAPKLQSLDDTINTAAAAGAGANGWTDLLVATANGRTQREKNSDFVTAKDYGAIQDGTLHTLAEKYSTLADAQKKYPFATSLNDSIDWAAIQLAINSRPHKAFFITNGESVINKKLIMTKPVHIIGDFENSAVYYTSDITDAALSYEPNTVGSRNTMVSRLHVLPYNNQAANTASAFRTVSTEDGGLNHLIIQQCDFRALGGGYAINLINDDANLNNDGTALVLIDNNTLVGGIKAPNLGDSCVIKYNNIKGKNIGIDASLVNGTYASASSFIVEKNNIVNDNGAIRLKNIRNTHVLHNNVEQLVALDLAEGRHVIEIDGDLDNSYSTVMFNKIEPSDPNKYCGGIKVSNLQAGAVKYNAIGTSAVLDTDFNIIGRTSAIKVINSNNLDVGDNTLHLSRGCNGIEIDELSKNIINVERQNYKYFNEAESTKVIDARGNLHFWKDVGGSNIAAYDANSTSLQAKIKDDVVYLRGIVKPVGKTGFNTSEVIGSLPVSMAPNTDVYLVQAWMNTGGTRGQYQLRIAKDGSILTPIAIPDVEQLTVNCSFTV